MADTVKVTVFIRTNNVGSMCEDVIEFDRDEWESMTEEEREEVCRNTAFNMGEWGWRQND